MQTGGVPEPSPPRFGPGEGWGPWTRVLRERPRPARIRAHRNAHWFTVATVCVVTIGLPAVRRDLGGSIGAVEWVSLAYLLTLVVLVLPAGRLADSLGRKSLYLYGFALFTVASLACGLAPGLAVLVAARVLQGAGAALMQANAAELARDAAVIELERQFRSIEHSASWRVTKPLRWLKSVFRRGDEESRNGNSPGPMPR